MKSDSRTTNHPVIESGGQTNTDTIKSDRILPPSPKLIENTYIPSDKSTNVVRSTLPPPIVPPEIFVKFVRKPYKDKALSLLKKLSEHSLVFTYDQFGVVSIRGNKLTGSTLFEYLPITFVNLKKKPENLMQWKELLFSLNLQHFIKNKHLLKMTSDEESEQQNQESNEELQKKVPNRLWYQL